MVESTDFNDQLSWCKISDGENGDKKGVLVSSSSSWSIGGSRLPIDDNEERRELHWDTFDERNGDPFFEEDGVCSEGETLNDVNEDRRDPGWDTFGERNGDPFVEEDGVCSEG